jgi:putative transcriptional regulator
MNDNDMTRVEMAPENLPAGETDWDAIDALDDEAVQQAALSDPDALPTPPEALAHFRRAIDVKAIRERLAMSQAEFAATFHLSLETVRDWEAAKRLPDPVARTLLRVIDRNPEAVKAALAAPPIR